MRPLLAVAACAVAAEAARAGAKHSFSGGGAWPAPRRSAPPVGAGRGAAFHDTSEWIGAEYTPWRASNQLWWHEYSRYRTDVVRELALVKDALAFNTLRVFLHSMLYDAGAEELKRNMADFLGVCDSLGFRVGFVFFDDCWNHAGANLSQPCVPRKGVHNGCWMASPQDVERTSVQRFEGYVSDLVSAFAQDRRVLWWEVFNEPDRTKNFSMSLRHAAYGWAKAQRPAQPVISCWDDSNDTDIVDFHQYGLPWGLGSPVFSNPAKGGLVTEAGARWYQKTAHDAGSPLTVVNWLGAARGRAPFVPGAMICWEVMVGHSQTRWHWGDLEGTLEPPVPWSGNLFPDGSPVSYTEAAAIRRHATGVDDFVFEQTWLDPSDPQSDERYLSLAPGEHFAWNGSITEGLIETSFWAANVSSDVLRLSFAGEWAVRVGPGSAGPHTLTLARSGSDVAAFDADRIEGGIVPASWNILRMLLQRGRVRVWLNPLFSDVTGGSVPPGDEEQPLRAMPPRIDYRASGTGSGGGGVAAAAGAGNSGAMRLDYLSVLPPKLYGLGAAL